MISSNIDKTNLADYYSRLRTRNELLRLNRVDEVYDKIPEIESIDQYIASISLDEAKRRILSPGSSNPEVATKLKELAKRKEAILVENGYKPDYLDPIYTCSRCMDTGWIGDKECTCAKKIRTSDLYKSSNLRYILKEENFDKFSLDYYSTEPYKNSKSGKSLPSPRDNMKKKLEDAKNFVDTFDTSFKNILIYGETGLGKTFLSNCIASELLESGHSVLYLSANELYENVISKYIMSKDDRTAIQPIYDYVYNSDLLIIDDLGSEVINSFVRSQTFEVINNRILNRKSTVISTNLDPHLLTDRYTERVMSRLVDNYDFYYLYGTNIRYIRKKNQFKQHV